MAKESTKKVAEDNDEQKAAYGKLNYDDQRKEDERKDRERLKAEHLHMTPEEKAELQNELSVLKREFEAEITRVREEFNEKKRELEEKIGASSVPENPGAVPTNETLSNGEPRRTLSIPVVA